MTPRRAGEAGEPAAAARPSQRAAPKVRRWTDLVAALLRHRYPVSFDELAREVPAYGDPSRDPASTKRMFERDKKELLRFGVPIRTMPDEHGEPTLYTIGRTDFYLPYLGLLDPATPDAGPTPPRHGRVDRYGYMALRTLAFEPDELAAVADGAARVRALGDPQLAADVESAMRKLAFDLPLGATAAVDAPHVVPPRARAEPAVLALLDEALRDRKLVTFAYRAMGDGERTTRTAEPYGLFYLGGHWYLAARDRTRGALRNFRVSRMERVSRNTARESTPDYQVPPDFHLRQHARSRQAWELGDGDAVEVVVELVRESGAAMAAARLGAPVAGAPRQRRFTVRRLDAFVRWLLALAGDARPLSPAALVAAYAEQLRHAQAHYAPDPGGAP
ncbi:MAG TPA: WYL domain-containing protein [Gemmatimonadaceae bacterium]|nr:WYL domain-containing protein [Gemmatimonadaceae bacterium]